jgi:hypothetical protein
MRRGESWRSGAVHEVARGNGEEGGEKKRREKGKREAFKSIQSVKSVPRQTANSVAVTP